MEPVEVATPGEMAEMVVQQAVAAAAEALPLAPAAVSMGQRETRAAEEPVAAEMAAAAAAAARAAAAAAMAESAEAAMGVVPTGEEQAARMVAAEALEARPAEAAAATVLLPAPAAAQAVAWAQMEAEEWATRRCGTRWCGMRRRCCQPGCPT